MSSTCIFQSILVKRNIQFKLYRKKKNERRKNILAILQTPFVRSVSLLFFSNVQLLLRASRVSHTLSWRNYIFSRSSTKFVQSQQLKWFIAYEHVVTDKNWLSMRLNLIFSLSFRSFVRLEKEETVKKRKKSRRKKIIALRQQLTNCVAWVTNKNAVT